MAKLNFKNTWIGRALFPTKRKYEGASRSNRTGSFPLNNMSANKDIGADATALRQRTRYLYQNTVYAKRGINGMSNGVVGTGIIPTVKTSNNQALAVINNLWKAFGEETVCDFYGRLTFSGITKLVAKTYLRDGEALVLRRRVPLSESPTGIQYQVLEMEFLADYICYPVLAGGGWTYNGIEYDKRGKTVAYMLFQRHPSEMWTQPIRVPADDVIHVLDVDFPAQNRGVPSGATTIIVERDLDEYEDAELMGKKVQASHAVFRVTSDPEKLDNPPNPDDYDGRDDLDKLEPGTIYSLPPGESILSNTPPTSPGAEDYRRSKQRNIAAGYEVTYEMMTGDYSNVNFSSGRMGWIEHQRTIEHKQWITLIPQFCSRAFKWFLDQVLIAPGGLTVLPRDLTVTWTTPRREMINPVDESEARLKNMRSGNLPWSEAVKQDGENPEDVLAAYKRDNEMWKKAGLTAEWSTDLMPNLKPSQGAPPPAK